MRESSQSPRRVVIVGANVTGASAAETLRREGFDGEIVLVGAEPHLPYERPPLSKAYLLALVRAGPDGEPGGPAFALRSRDFYDAQRIELRLSTTARALDVDRRLLALDTGERLAFDRLLIATGTTLRRLPVPGADLPGVLSLRTLDDAHALAGAMRAAQMSGGRAVIVGAGFIGSEIAAACREVGLDVTLVELLDVPLQRVLGAEIGAHYAAMHRAHGVDLRLGVAVRAVHGAADVEALELASGENIACAFAVVGVGVRAADDWLAGSGVARDDGVLVNEFCQTSAPGIFAAGDVARWPYLPVGATEPMPVRLEHWDNGLRQGEVAARNLLGSVNPYRPVPYFWSDQYDTRLQYLGYAPTWDACVVRGDPASGAFVAGYQAGGRLRAALAVNRVRDFVALKKLVGAGAQLDPAQIADERVDLRALAAAQ